MGIIISTIKKIVINFIIIPQPQIEYHQEKEKDFHDICQYLSMMYKEYHFILNDLTEECDYHYKAGVQIQYSNNNVYLAYVNYIYNRRKSVIENNPNNSSICVFE